MVKALHTGLDDGAREFAFMKLLAYAFDVRIQKKICTIDQHGNVLGNSIAPYVVFDLRDGPVVLPTSVLAQDESPMCAYSAGDPSVRNLHLIVGIDIEAIRPASPVRRRVTGGGALLQVPRRILSLGRGGATADAAEQTNGLEEEELSHGEQTLQRANRNER